MTELHDLTASMLAILENDGQLAKKIGEASIRIVAGIIEEDNRFTMQQLQQYASFFCVGAAWALTNKELKKERSHEGWVILYRDSAGYLCTEGVYDTKEEADEFDITGYIATVPIRWEE